MNNIKFINHRNEIPTINDPWICSSKFNSKDRLIDEKGKEVISGYEGSKYQIIEKRERTFSIPERIGRGFLGTLAVICSLCLSLLFFSKTVKNLFMKSKENVRFAIFLPKIEVNIPSEVKKTLDQLFEGSSYAIDNLPIYPVILNRQDGLPKRKVMTAPIMKGVTDDGRPFIAIKLDCNLTDENIEKAGMSEELENRYKTHRQLEDILFLYQYHTNGPLFWWGEGKFLWLQLSIKSMTPLFFTANFTYPEDGTGPTESQKNNFELIQTLLKEGQSKDTQGLIWRIPLE